MSERLVTLRAFLMHETEKAFFVQTENGNVWVPKAQSEYDAEEEQITLPEWLAIEKGLV